MAAVLTKMMTGKLLQSVLGVMVTEEGVQSILLKLLLGSLRFAGLLAKGKLGALPW